MKLLGLFAIALPAALAAEQKCSCEIQAMFNRLAKISKDMDSQDYYMHHYNDILHFIDDEVLPQATITLKSENIRWEDVDAGLAQSDWEKPMQEIENTMKEEEMQKIMKAPQVKAYWNAVSTFYHDMQQYVWKVQIGRAQPEWSAWTKEMKDNDGFRVNFFSTQHATAFHKAFAKFMTSLTGPNLTVDVQKYVSFLKKMGIPANNFIAWMEKEYGTAARIMNMGRSHDNKIDVWRSARNAVESAGEQFGKSMEAMFDDGKNGTEYQALFQAIQKELEKGPQDAIVMGIVEKNIPMLENMGKDPPQYDFVKLFKMIEDITKTTWFSNVMGAVAGIPEYLAVQVTAAEMTDVFLKADAVLDDMGRNGRSSAKPACICNGYNGADVFKYSKVVMPVCAAAGVYNLLN